MGVIVLKKVISVFLLVTLTLSMLTSCRTAEITILYHKDTLSVGGPIEEINFSDPNLEKYQINGILFYPFIRHKSANSDLETYYLKLKTIRPNEVADNVVVINKVKVEGEKDISFTPISNDLNTKLKFINEDGSSSIQTSRIDLIEQLNDYNIKLNEHKSQLKVIINVSVADGNQIISKDLIYIFEADKKGYSTLLQ